MRDGSISCSVTPRQNGVVVVENTNFGLLTRQLAFKRLGLNKVGQRCHFPPHPLVKDTVDRRSLARAQDDPDRPGTPYANGRRRRPRICRLCPGQRDVQERDQDERENGDGRSGRRNGRRGHPPEVNSTSQLRHSSGNRFGASIIIPPDQPTTTGKRQLMCNSNVSSDSAEARR